jgi:TetR/AcrR family transcriptional regulator, transcriptional repressor for nem operon
MRTKWHDPKKIHAEILAAALSLLKENGVGTPVDAIMKAAGLTSGALYTHFRSKEDLCMQAICTGLDKMADRYRTIVAERGGDALTYIVEEYLSADHVHDVRGGCTLAALGADMTRASPKAKEAYEMRIEALVRVLAEGFDAGPEKKRRARARRLLSSMLGALTLSRAMRDAGKINEFLSQVRESALRDLAPSAD